jgi:hypothetical protein
MHMRRPHRVTAGLDDHLADRAVGRDRIAAGQYGAEMEFSLGVSDEEDGPCVA